MLLIVSLGTFWFLVWVGHIMTFLNYCVCFCLSTCPSDPFFVLFISCSVSPGLFDLWVEPRVEHLISNIWFGISSSFEVTSANIFVTVSFRWAMSSSGCCQLPGSLCDYSGNNETDASKDSEESDSTTQAQYVAKVTAKDGHPLSTVVKAVSLQRYVNGKLSRGSYIFTWI